MGLLTYDPPTLGTVGSQPATDIADALTEIKTEANGLIETTNLADNGVNSIAATRRTTYREITRLVPFGMGPQTITSTTASSGLIGVSLKMTAASVTSTGGLRAVLQDGSGAVIATIRDGSVTTTPTTFYTRPGTRNATSGTTAPIIVDPQGDVLRLTLQAFVFDINVTDLVLNFDYYEDF